MTKQIQKNELSRVSELIMQGIECWIEAGKIIAGILDDNPDSMSRIVEVTGMDENIIRRFYQIGKQQLHPRILCSTAMGIMKLANCQYHEQEKYLVEPIEVLVSNGETLKVKAENLTQQQVKQVFNRDHVRALPEQKAWLATDEKRRIEAEQTKRAEVAEANYTIRNHKVLFRKGVEMSQQELVQLLARM